MIFSSQPPRAPAAKARTVAPSIIFLLAIACGKDARADETIAAQPVATTSNTTFEIGGVASYLTPPVHGGTTPFGLGFGGRVGFSFSDIYMGASVIQYLGGTDVDTSDRALLYGMEFGYGPRFPAFGGAFVTVRPTVGVGGAAVSHTDPSLLSKADVVTSASGGGGPASDTVTVTYLYVQPGITGILASGSHFVALDTSALVIPSISYGGASQPSTWLSFGTRVELGFVF